MPTISTTNGSKVDVARLPGTVAADISAIAAGTGSDTPVTTATVTPVASSDTSVTLAASNTARKGLLIFNDSTAAVFVKFGATASAASFTVKLLAGEYYEFPRPIYTGVIAAIWVSANGNALVTELA